MDMNEQKILGMSKCCFAAVVGICLIGIVIGSMSDFSINVALANKQVQFQAQQAAHRQQQAAFDSYNQAWQARSDAHHQQFRAATNAQFATPAPGSAAPDYSEAIRGVNTYTTSDGREVEVSVQADRAWENQSGDVIGTSGGFDPGADWTQLPRT